MTRKELVALVAKQTGVHQDVVVSVANSLFDMIGATLANGENVKYVNFGVFEVRPRRAVERRNPRTGEMIKVPAKQSLGFRPAPSLRNKVAGS